MNEEKLNLERGVLSLYALSVILSIILGVGCALNGAWLGLIPSLFFIFLSSRILVTSMSEEAIERHKK